MVSTNAVARAADPPLFVVLKAICLETGAHVDVVKAKIEAAGGKLIGPAGTSSGDVFQIQSTIWQHVIAGKTIRISAGTLQAASKSGPIDIAEGCGVELDGRDDASIDALRRWVGVAPTKVMKEDPVQYIYEYQDQAGKRSAFPSAQPAQLEAVAAGQVWKLQVYPSPEHPSARVWHFLPAASRTDY
jgi:hypothetical protein